MQIERVEDGYHLRKPSGEFIHLVRNYNGVESWACAAIDYLTTAGLEAADVLRREAAILRDRHTLDGAWNDDDLEIQSHYDQMMELADRLTPPGLTPNAAISEEA